MIQPSSDVPEKDWERETYDQLAPKKGKELYLFIRFRNLDAYGDWRDGLFARNVVFTSYAQIPCGAGLYLLNPRIESNAMEKIILDYTIENEGVEEFKKLSRREFSKLRNSLAQ